MPLTLHRATRADADECHALLYAFDKEQGLPLGSVGWSHPRVRALVHDDAGAGRLYVARDREALVATFALCDIADPYYALAAWSDPNASAAVLHRLAVAPDRRASGVGSWCLAEAERLTAEAGRAYLRLDALLDHGHVVRWYRHHGYSERGVAYLPTGEPRNPTVGLVLLEKPIGAARP